ncbi:ribosomal protein S15 [Hamiltosporidium magnivora]|nr:ribosomal protein S15 [Hamiltosporidium magnivora]
MEMPLSKFATLLPSHLRRRIRRGISQREVDVLTECQTAKENCVTAEDKPAMVKTQARTMIIFPQMIGNLIGVHNGFNYVPVDIKPEMIGYVLGDFAPTRLSCSHGKPGVGATSSSKFVPLK